MRRAERRRRLFFPSSMPRPRQVGAKRGNVIARRNRRIRGALRSEAFRLAGSWSSPRREDRPDERRCPGVKSVCEKVAHATEHRTARYKRAVTVYSATFLKTCAFVCPYIERTPL